jgi:ribonuclease HI
MKVTVFVDASVRKPGLKKSGQAYSWVAVGPDGSVLQTKTQRIPTGLNPEFDNNVAEGLALLAARRAAAELGDCEFRSDCQNLVLQVKAAIPVSRHPRIRKIVERLKGIVLDFEQQTKFIYMSDYNSKGILNGQQLHSTPNKMYSKFAKPTTLAA